MEDLSSMLSNTMNDPQQMAKLQAMAGSLFGGNTPPPAQNEPTSEGLDISPNQIAGMMKMANLLKNSTADHRSGVLMALRPYLSEHRQKRVDDAIKLLRLVSILPAIKDAGLF